MPSVCCQSKPGPAALLRNEISLDINKGGGKMIFLQVVPVDLTGLRLGRFCSALPDTQTSAGDMSPQQRFSPALILGSTPKSGFDRASGARPGSGQDQQPVTTYSNRNSIRALEAIMFNPTQIVIQAFVEQLKGKYSQIYGILEPAYPDIISFVARLALENIANTDAAYHDMNHTIMVTLVGQDILLGKHTSEGGVRPRDWLHFMISLLCHDIGYVRGVCRADRNGYYVCSENGDLVQISAGATDASLTPYHVTRSKLFVRERFGKVSLAHIDTQEIEANIEHTRFPVPEDEEYTNTADYPSLVRAADLIGQLADIDYLRKTSALFAEFRETGASEKLGYQTPDDLRAAYPAFFWKAVCPYIGDALRYLRVTQEGKQWIANLYAHVFSEEHRGAITGA